VSTEITSEVAVEKPADVKTETPSETTVEKSTDAPVTQLETPTKEEPTITTEPVPELTPETPSEAAVSEPPKFIEEEAKRSNDDVNSNFLGLEPVVIPDFNAQLSPVAESSYSLAGVGLLAIAVVSGFLLLKKRN